MEALLRTISAAFIFIATIVGLSAVGAMAPHAAESEPRVHKEGFLWGLPPIAEWVAALDQGLAELGWVSGRNIVIEHRSADGHFDRLPALTADLIGLKASLIIALSAPETAAAKKLTGDIPIVFVVHGDPIGTGDIKSLA